MKTSRSLLLVVATVTSVLTCRAESPYNFVWAQASGAFPYDLAANADGHSWVCGYYLGSASFGVTNLVASTGGNTDAFLAKYDSSGNLVWVRRTGGPSGSSVDARTVAIDAVGNIYTAGRFVGSVSFGTSNVMSTGSGTVWDLYLAKQDSNGNVLWVRQFPGRPNSDRNARCLGVDYAGNVYLGGDFEIGQTIGSFSLSGNPNGNGFLARFDNGGSCLWAKTIAGTLGTIVQDLSTDNNGSIAIAGHFQGAGSFGNTNVNSLGSWDAFACKFDGNGEVTWLRTVGSGGDDYGTGIKCDSVGNVVFVGMFRNTIVVGTTNLTSTTNHNVFIAKYSSAGQVQWSRRAGAPGVFSLAVDQSNDFYLTGELEGTGDFGSTNLVSVETPDPQFYGDVYVAKISGAGEFQWATVAGGGSFDAGRAIAVDADKHPFVAGYFSETVTFGQTNLTSIGRGMFIGKLDVSASPASLSIEMYSGLSIEGTVGATYRIQYVANLQNSNAWATLATIVLTHSPQLWFDVDSPRNVRRFYRAVP
jgi:hypothetical protein